MQNNFNNAPHYALCNNGNNNNNSDSINTQLAHCLRFWGLETGIKFSTTWQPIFELTRLDFMNI